MKEQLRNLTIGSIICLLLIEPALSLYSSNAVLAQETSNFSDPTQIFRDAYENRYTWDKNFPGYTATVNVSIGKKKYTGNITITSNLSVKVAGIDNQDARTIVENQLRMLVVHRRRVPFEVEHKNSTFQVGKTDKDGVVEIFEHGEKTDAHYKIFNSELKQVNRVLGNTAVTVDVLASEKTPSGYLATKYRTIFRQVKGSQANAKGCAAHRCANASLLGEEDEQDTYDKIGGYYLLTKTIVSDVDFKQNKRTTTVINFANNQLL